MNAALVLKNLAPSVADTRRGASVLLRPALPTDLAPVADLLHRLHDDSWYFRYLGPRPRAADAIRNEAQRLVRDQTWLHTTLIVVMEHGGRDQAVAVAELGRDLLMPDVADIAIAVRDDLQNNGIGSLLLERLVGWARATGVTTLRADLFADNHGAKRLLQRLPFERTTALHDGAMQVWVHLEAHAATADAARDLFAQIELAA